jgi:hypothetical protein
MFRSHPRPSSGQYFPVEVTIGAHYTLWDPKLLIGCGLKMAYKSPKTRSHTNGADVCTILLCFAIIIIIIIIIIPFFGVIKTQ